MARENRRRRAERLQGRRLFVDMLFDREWCMPKWCEPYMPGIVAVMVDEKEQLLDIIAKSKIVHASNVCEYHLEHFGPDGRRGRPCNIQEDLPVCVPPFDSMFIDCSWRRNPIDGTSMYWGILVQANLERSGQENPIVICRLFSLAGTGETGRVAQPIIAHLAYDKDLNIRGFRPIRYFPVSYLAARKIPGDQMDLDPVNNIADALAASLLFPALLAISFMNCKNVAITPVDPDRKLNRERERRGFKPFLRYHTIDIEPMKAVLRTEGNIETEGLKRALHICRGHFATYSQERPLFGRVAGTFWVPAHVRGSAKQGVIVSDYEVQAPKRCAADASSRATP